MNEFIVWSEEKNKFITNEVEFCIQADGSLCKPTEEPYEDGLVYMDSYFKYFNYIGKDDADGKKIYADCSVVEFDFRFFDEDEYEKLVGYFSYNDDLAMFELREPYTKDEYRIYYLNKNDIKNFKIIGTLQEKPELLEV